MKKIFCELVCIVFFANLFLSNGVIDGVCAENNVFVEEEIISNVTLEDEFADNRVMVVMSNEVSLQFNQYDAGDFSEINCNRVSNLSTATEAKVKSASANASITSVSKATNSKHDIDISDYNQVLCLELKDAGKENVLQAIQKLQKREDVIYAGPDYVIQVCSTTPDDEYYNKQWAPEKIQLPQAWDITMGSPTVYVGVLDTGIEGTHPDLAGNIDISLCRDFTSGSAIAVAPTDPRGHGTTVAGIIGALGDNDAGISGVCWDVTLVSLRILDAQGYGYSSYAANAINYAESQGISILNMSVSWTGQQITSHYDYALNTVIASYSGLVVCSAGNDSQNNDNTALYPGNYVLPNLITVGASNEDDSKRASSNYGKITVDLFAPGSNIYTTFSNQVYGRTNGTSMAAPYVTGVAALLLSKYPDLMACEIKDTILTNVDEISALEDLCATGGRLNAYNALTNVQRHSTSIGHSTYEGHVRICTDDARSETISHSYTYVSNGSAGHNATCSECGFSVTNQHDMLYQNIGVGIGHTGTCSHCGYTCTEAHTWIAVGTKYRCGRCAALTTAIPTPFASLPPEVRAKLEQMGYVGDFAMDIGDGTVLCRVGDQYYLVAGQTEETALSYLQNELSVITPIPKPHNLSKHHFNHPCGR